jgi:DNA repair protein SbcD/Mre11
MKIAITADLHLTSRAQHPQRFRALENILDQMQARQIGDLVIAGDLFDASLHNYAEFETLCQSGDYRQIHFHIIPGNHDANINENRIVAPNVSIYSQPELVRLDPQGQVFLFLPYQSGRTMGEALANFKGKLAIDKWVLIGHGDWTDGLRLTNPYEGGIYMPLSRRDMLEFNPAMVFLGHIHIPYDKGNVYYPGSPCGLNISETGLRRFLVCDLGRNIVESVTVDTEVIYFDETIVVLPIEDEQEFLRYCVKQMITRWGLSAYELQKVCLRLKLTGYSSNKARLLENLKEMLAGINLYDEVEHSQVSVAVDDTRSQIVEVVRNRIVDLEWGEQPDQPSKDEILIEALAIIYGS